MIVLTPAERRAVLLVVGLLIVGTLVDVWETHRSRPQPLDPWPRAGSASEASDTAGSAGGVRDSLDTADPNDAEAPARVDVNRATVAELEALPGVGPVLARRIHEHRRLHGPFRDPRDLRAVRGIGPRLYERLRPLVRVTSAAPER